jgi:anti-anti-sigma factor
MGRPNDLFGPETTDSAPLPVPRPASPTAAPSAAQSEAASAGDDGLITVSGMENVALVFIAVSGIREHQADMVQRRLTAVADRCHGRVAVSLSELVSLNSSGINALVAVHTHCVSLGGHLALFAMSEDVRRVFKVTKLDKKMVLAGNAHEAVQSFTKPKKSFLRGAFSWAKQDRDAA